MTNHGPHRAAALRAGRAALVVGLLYAAVSVYWGLGGTALLDTVGGTLESAGRAGSPVVLLALWAAVALKLVAAVLPLLALRRPGTPRRHRLLRVLAWAAAAILTLYGLLLTTVGCWCRAASSTRQRTPIIERSRGTPTSGTRGSSSGACW